LVADGLLAALDSRGLEQPVVDEELCTEEELVAKGRELGGAVGQGRRARSGLFMQAVRLDEGERVLVQLIEPVEIKAGELLGDVGAE